MNLKKTFAFVPLITAFILFSQTLHAFEEDQNSTWIEITSSGTKKFYGKRGSFSYSKFKEGNDLIRLVVQMTDSSTNNIEYQKLLITSSECNSGAGKLIVGDMSGNRVFSIDYVDGGQSVGARIGTAMCLEYKKQKSNESSER